MPYFYKEDTYQIVYRLHEFNSEALSGDIIKIPEVELCALLAHIPNTRQGWDVKLIAKVMPEEGLLRVEELGSEKTAKKGQPYYTLIKLDKSEEYINTKAEYRPAPANAKISSVIQNPEIPHMRSREESESSEVKYRREKYKVRLLRDDEEPIKILR